MDDVYLEPAKNLSTGEISRIRRPFLDSSLTPFRLRRIFEVRDALS
jgi:hypothetical protein